MKPQRFSVATIRSPEFINLQPTEISPLISKCEIKVMYINENRNQTFMSKETVTEMAKTLRGCPIVGYYSEEKEDFREHSELITIDEDGIHFEVLTKPYGFVAPDAQVWFKEFEDTDEFGNKTLREYLMTTGYLWTGQFEECQRVIDQGNPHSMELDKNHMNGRWATNQKTGIDFFIVNDAWFSKLCILGEDVEPCFEGSDITAPKISANFTKDEKKFTQTLYSMMKELTTTIEGGIKMELENTQVQEPVVDTNTPAPTPATNEPETQASLTGAETPVETPTQADNATVVEEKGAEEFTNTETPTATPEATVPVVGNATATSDYANMEAKYNEVVQKCEQLQREYQEMASLYQKMAKEKKEALIAKFSMLTDEDKKDVIDNIDTYSYDEIESKLSVIGFRKGANFNRASGKDSVELPKLEELPVTYNLNEPTAIPDIVQALRANKK